MYSYFAAWRDDGVFTRLNGLLRRLARDYETLPTSSEAMINLAMIDNMTRRLTGENTPTWRGT